MMDSSKVAEKLQPTMKNIVCTFLLEQVRFPRAKRLIA